MLCTSSSGTVQYHYHTSHTFLNDGAVYGRIHCHDMAGGYLDDRFATGCATEHIYNFYNWQFVDTFIYFSHHRITVPRTQSPSRISNCWSRVKRSASSNLLLFCFLSCGLDRRRP